MESRVPPFQFASALALPSWGAWEGGSKMIWLIGISGFLVLGGLWLKMDQPSLPGAVLCLELQP